MEMRRQPEHTYSVGLISLKTLAPLDGEGHGVASAEAEGGDAALEIAALQFVEQGDEDARAAGVSLLCLRQHRGSPVQLLPQLQMQPVPLLPPVQARSRRN